MLVAEVVLAINGIVLLYNSQNWHTLNQILKLKDHLVSHTFILQVSLLSEGHRLTDLSQGREASLLLKQIGTFIF